MSIAAFTALEEFYKDHSSTSPVPANPADEEDWVFRGIADRADFACYMTSKYSLSDKSKIVISPMHFREFLAEVSDDGKEVKIIKKQGMFEHPLILKVLSTYLSCVDTIPGGIQRLQGKPFGALEIAVQAVERALTFYHTGQSTLDLTQSEHHFSYVNWGSQPVKNAAGEETGKLRHEEFHNTIRKLSDEKWKAILDGARSLMTTKRKPSKKAAEPREAEGEDEDDNGDDIIMSDPPEPVADSVSQSMLQMAGANDIRNNGNGDGNGDGNGKENEEGHGNGHDGESGEESDEEGTGDDGRMQEGGSDCDSDGTGRQGTGGDNGYSADEGDGNEEDVDGSGKAESGNAIVEQSDTEDE
ncbi:hypothetical protein D9758_016892 [Tetrapyrgos nigripes]|nr:hypothetical protein D9758_016892 [Tetrapyrgos nigripes]